MGLRRSFITTYYKKLGQLLDWLQNYKERTNCKGVVLGISGGKDSTVVAMLAKKVWGDNVLGILMPNGEQADIGDSIDIVTKLKLSFWNVNIGDTYSALISEIVNNQKVSDKAKTNIPPRLRMTTLYAIAQTIGFQVIGTGNADERYLGWFTKWGDGACDFNPIGNLTCTEVIEIGKILAEEFKLPLKYIEKTPSDGLTGKSDEDNFGFTYKQAEDIISGNIYNCTAETLGKVVRMNKSTEHKRNPIPMAEF